MCILTYKLLCGTIFIHDEVHVPVNTPPFPGTGMRIFKTAVIPFKGNCRTGQERGCMRHVDVPHEWPTMQQRNIPCRGNVPLGGGGSPERTSHAARSRYGECPAKRIHRKGEKKPMPLHPIPWAVNCRKGIQRNVNATHAWQYLQQRTIHDEVHVPVKGLFPGTCTSS